ncbi:hypothetical protein WSM22_16040 [Cytophagales bacterium WSM2-2]|nr:hypothetical protein WSM22_16040 [Cytophagales bacterium WSM2-2]
MRYLTFFSLQLISFVVFSQPSSEEDKLTANLNFGTSLPSGILTGRAIVLYEIAYTQAELQEAQKYFQQSGIDAVAYMDMDYVLAGIDPARVYSKYFTSRSIRFFILLQKKNSQYQIIITEYNGTTTLVDKSHASWTLSNANFPELLRSVYRFAISSEKKTNFLINDTPETNVAMNFYRGKQDERFSPDVRQFKLAIPRFGNDSDDAALTAFLKENFRAKYELVDPALSDAELSDKGFRLVLRFVHTRGDAARDILGYDMSQTSSSYSSNYFEGNELKIKTIRAKKMIYKFYFKNTEYGNVFLGTKWDADETWLDALRNHILALRKDLKI